MALTHCEQDPLPEMRSISCWVLSRYSELFQINNGKRHVTGITYSTHTSPITYLTLT